MKKFSVEVVHTGEIESYDDGKISIRTEKNQRTNAY